MKRNLSSASGQGVGKALLEPMTASATSSFILTTGPIGVRVVVSHSRGWMRSTGIVSIYLLDHNYPQLNAFQFVQRGDRTARKLKMKPKLTVGSPQETRWDRALQTLLAASWRWT